MDIVPASTPRRRPDMRAVVKTVAWWLIAAIVLVVFIARERGEILHAVTAMRTASPGWLALALAGGLLLQALLALTFRPLLRRVGSPISVRVLLDAQMQRLVIGTVVPAGAAAAVYAGVRRLGRAGVSTDDALFVALVNSALGYASFITVLLPALAVIGVSGRLSGLILFGAAAMLLLVIVLSGGLILLLRGSRASEGLLSRLPSHRIADRLRQFVVQARQHGLRPRDLVAPFAINLSIEVVGILTLFACLRAVGWRSSWQEALVGYGVGTLFLLIAPVFQGIGAVELSMTVALTGLGVPAGTALAAVLLYRSADIWLPFVAGATMQAGQQREVRWVSARLPAVFSGLSGLLAVLSVLAPHLSRRLNHLREYSLTDPTDLSRHITLIAGFFLIFLSWSLWRRKRIAWIASTILLAITIPTHLMKRHDGIALFASVVALVLLLVERDHFRVRSDLPTIGRGILRFALSLTFAVVYGTLGFFLIDERAFHRDFSPIDAVRETLRQFFTLGSSGLTPHTRYADWFLDSLQFVGVISVVYALFSLIRPVVWRRRTQKHERARAAELISAHGDSSLDFFKTWPDKIIFLSSTGNGVVAYRVALGCAVALGDPVATDAAEFDRVLTEFLDFCDANDWRVAFHQTPETRRDAYHRAGLSMLKVGEEAVVDLTTFCLSGKAMKHLRATVNRFDREGYREVWRDPPLDDSTLARLREVSDEWLTIDGRRERGFTLGRFENAYVRSTPVMAIEDPEGWVAAFANLIPDGVAGEATIDLMRRRREPSGSMDVLQVRLFEALRERGYRSFSLGMAPFAEVGGEPEATIAERAVPLFYERFNRFFSYKGLREYKAKFQPRWEPRYIVYASEVQLPLIALALLRVTEEEDEAWIRQELRNAEREEATVRALARNRPIPAGG
ncbi:MAG TPA: flippase-like domain-containing protein [Thermomicrobiales bacterium]|nr:flippase-like domain-containing protein [Thermomicrobiales bacterium]